MPDKAPTYYLKQHRLAQVPKLSLEKVAAALEEMKDLPQYAMAATAGLSQETLTRIENRRDRGIGRRDPVILHMLADLYGTTIEGLMSPPQVAANAHQDRESGPLEPTQKRDNSARALNFNPIRTTRGGNENVGPYDPAKFSHIVPVMQFGEAGNFVQMTQCADIKYTVGCYAPEYAGIELLGYELLDDSMGEIYPRGSVVIFGDYERLKPLQKDDKVVIRRKREGGPWETIVRQVCEGDNGLEFFARPLSGLPVAPILAESLSANDRDRFEIVGIVVDWRPARPQRSGVILGLAKKP